jgi:hypothetical protein
MGNWNYQAMGRVGLTGTTAKIAKPIAASISRRTGRPQSQILGLIGASFLAMYFAHVARTVTQIIAAGRKGAECPPRIDHQMM